MTRPLAPLSLPDSTTTVSPFFTFIDGALARLVADFCFWVAMVTTPPGRAR